jgi:hypothetical protein
MERWIKFEDFHMSWTHAWNLWFHGHQLGPDVRIWGLRLLWWSRIADVLAFVSGLSVVFELLGAHPLKNLGEKLIERARRARLMRKHAPIYAQQLNTYNDLVECLALDIRQSIGRPGPQLTWTADLENDQVARDDYEQLALDTYRQVTDHACDDSHGVRCVHAFEIIIDSVWDFMSENGSKAEQESWKVNDDAFTDLLSLLMAALCWLLIPTGIIFGIIELVRVLPAIWLTALAAAAIPSVSFGILFCILAQQRSRKPLVVLAKLGNVMQKPRPWNRPFAFLFHWTGKHYYTFPYRTRHSATWRISAITAQYALASVLISFTRPTGFVLNRPKPDHLLRWALLAPFIISFFPIIITQ